MRTRFISRNVARVLLADRGIRYDSPVDFASRFENRIEHAVVRTREIDFVNFAGQIVSRMFEPGAILLIDEFGIWPSSENLWLYNLVREHIAENDFGRTDYSVEFHSASKEEVVTLFQLAVEFGWGGILLFDKNNWVNFHHDEWAIVYTEKNMNSIFEYLKGSRLKFEKR